MDIPSFVHTLEVYLTGSVYLTYIIIIGILCSIALRFAQVRYFGKALKQIFTPEPTAGIAEGKAEVTPIQAFLNTLNANFGNGAVVGPAVAVFAGGPGALAWYLIIGVLLMAIRYSEVYLSIYFGSKASPEHIKTGLGGPMLYLLNVPAGRFLSYVYAFFGFAMCIILGCGFQANSISTSLETTWSVPQLATAIFLLVFVVYVMLGGAHRVAQVSEKIVPFKVGLFLLATFAVLVYNYQALWSSLVLIFTSGLGLKAFTGGAMGFTLQQAMSAGVQRSIMASEAGLGSAAIMFGATSSKSPVKDSMLAMVGTFISIILCFIMGLSIVASGVWNSGAQGTTLAIQAFSSVFGIYGGWVISILAATLGLGVLAAYVYIFRELFLFLTGGRFAFLLPIIYGFFTFGGALVSLGFVIDCGDIAMALMVIINLFAIAYLLPVIRKGFLEFEKTGK